MRVILNLKLIDGDKPQIPNSGGQEREGISSDRDFLSLERGADKVHCAFLSLLLAPFLYHHFCSQGQNLEGLFVAAVLHDLRHSITWEEYRDGQRTIAFDR